MIWGLFTISFIGLAQTPANDSCSNAQIINIGYNPGVILSDTVSIDSATVEIGEWFHASLVSAGNDKRSIWFKFYLPTARAVDIELKQTANAIAIRDAGFTTYYTDQCLPSSIQASNAKITTLNQFGSSFHPCLEPGWYIVQVSAKARAAGDVFIQITTEHSYKQFGINNVTNDLCSLSYDFDNNIVGAGGYTTNTSSITLGCYSIDDSTELFKDLGYNYHLYNQSAWYRFHAADYNDNTRFYIRSSGSHAFTDTMAYRLFEGNCNSGFRLIDSGIGIGSNPQGGCSSWNYALMNKNYNCFFDSSKVYHLQLLFHEDSRAGISVSIYDYTNRYDSSANRPLASEVIDAGLISDSKYVPFGFSCNNYISDHSCGSNAVDANGIHISGSSWRFNLSQWMRFRIDETSRLTVHTTTTSGNNSKNYRTIGVRLFKDTVSSNCADVDTAQMLSEYVYYNRFDCLEPGEYVLQILGTDTARDCSHAEHLGGEYRMYFSQQKLPARNRFSLYKSGAADSIYARNNSIISLPGWQTVYGQLDTVACNDAVLPLERCDTNKRKAMYRVFTIGDIDNDQVADSGCLSIRGLNYSYGDHRIYQGNAIALRDAQNVNNFPDTLFGLKPYTVCNFSNASDLCITPGTYTLVSFFDQSRISTTEQPSFYFQNALSKYNTYNTAEFIDSITNYGSYNGQYDKLSCRENPDTIDGVFCGNRNTYHVFYLDTVSEVTLSVPWNSYRYYGRRFSLFKGDIRTGKNNLKIYNDGSDWKCIYASRRTQRCKPLEPGWYTVVISVNGWNTDFKTDTADVFNYTHYLYTNHRIQMSFSAPTVVNILPQFNKPEKAANVDSLINNNLALQYDTNYSTRKAMSFNRKVYTFPAERLQLDCDIDTLPIDFPDTLDCLGNSTNVVYYTFGLKEASWAAFYTGGLSYSQYRALLFPFDIRKEPGKLDSVAPIQTCTPRPELLEYCKLPKGRYTLVYLIRRNTNQNFTLQPYLYLDSVVKASPYDHAANAYDFGRIPGNNQWIDGKVGTVHPADTSLPASHTIISCETGSQYLDPTEAGVCYASWNPQLYNPVDSIHSLFPYDSAYTRINGSNYYYPGSSARKNVWYTFTHKGAGNLEIALKGHNLDGNRAIRFNVYQSDVDGSILFDSLKRIGGIDSLINQGLVSYGGSRGNCRYNTNMSLTITNSVCEPPVEKRYYVLVETNNYSGIANRHTWLEIKYDSNTTPIYNSEYDYISNAGNISNNNGANLIINGDASQNRNGWTRSSSYWSAVNTSSFSYGNTGYSFYGDGYRLYSRIISMYQDVDLNGYLDSIQKGANIKLNFKYFTTKESPEDEIRAILVFYNASGQSLDTFQTSWMTSGGDWNDFTRSLSIPKQSHRARLKFEFRRNTTGNLYYYRSGTFIDEIQLTVENSSKDINALRSRRLYRGLIGHLGTASLDSTDFNRTDRYNSCSDPSVAGTIWYKFKVDSTGYIYYNFLHTNYYRNNDFRQTATTATSNLRLYKEVIPGDTLYGLEEVNRIGTTSGYSNLLSGSSQYACITPGTYYLQLNRCNWESCIDYYIPQIVVDYHYGDYCDNAVPLYLDTLEQQKGQVFVNCHTIGESYGEDGSDMGCLYGPDGYKSSWFKVEYDDTTKVDLEFKMNNLTNQGSSEIRYRTYYGNCRSLTAAPCNNDVLTTFTLDCIRKGTYYVQVVSPNNATGTLELSVEAKKNIDTTCNPVDIFQPNAAFYYNTACPENEVQFVNTSSRGDSIGYLWDFGYNHATDTTVNPAFPYPPLAVEKEYTVKLIVYHRTRGSRDSIIQKVKVPYAPALRILSNDTTVCDGEQATFRGSLSHGIGYWNTLDTANQITTERSGWYQFRQIDKPNLLVNGDAESHITNNGWKANSGGWTQWSWNPRQGARIFYPSTNAVGLAELQQEVDVSFDSTDIDSGIAKTSLSGFISSYPESVPDEGQIVLEYLDGNGGLLYVYRSGYIKSPGNWQKVLHSQTTPKRTRKLRVRLQANNFSSWNYAVFDDLILKMRSACDYKDSVLLTVRPIPQVDAGNDTFFCYNESLTLAPRVDYPNPFIVQDSLNGGPVNGKLIGNARYIRSLGQLVLTEEINSEFGALGYQDSSLEMSDSFDIQFDWLVSSTDNQYGDWGQVYLFHSKEADNSNMYFNGGYSIYIYEYLNRNEIYLFWRTSSLYTIRLNEFLSDGQWRHFRFNYNNKKFTFYMNGKKIGAYQDNASRTAAGPYYGIAASNSSYDNRHVLKNFIITRSKTNVHPDAPSLWNFRYEWDDSSTSYPRNITQGGTYAMKVTDRFGCESEYDSVVVQRIKTYDSLLWGDYNVCDELDTFRLNPGVSGGFFYGDLATDSSGLVTISQTNFGPNQVYYQLTDSLGCDYFDTAIYLVDSVPDIQIQSAGPVCKNAVPFTLQVNNNNGFFYGGTYIDSSGLFDPSKTTQGSKKVYYRTRGNDCVGMDSITIIVDSIPSAAITAAGPFCENGGMQVLTAAVNAGGRFFGGSFIDSAGNFDPSVATAGTHKVYYSFTDGNTCSNTDSATILVDTIPSAAITAAGPFCENAGVQVLSATVNAGGRFFGGSFIDSAGNFDPDLATAGTHQIYYSFTDGNSCSNTDSSTILVDTVPSAAIVAAGPFCENGGSQLLSAAINSGGRFFGGSFIDSAGNFDPAMATAGTHKVYYSFTDGNSCSNTDSTLIRIDSIPSAAITSAGPFCENGGMQVLTAAVNAGGRFFGGDFIDSTGNFDPSVATAGTHKVYYSFTDGNTCSNTDSATILVDTIPSAAITAAGPFCENAGVQVLSATVNAGGRFFGGSFIDSAGNFDPDLATAGTHQIYYSFTDGNSCSNTDSSTILVDTIPSAAIVAAGPFCENGGSQLLSANINSGGRFFGGSFIDSAGNFDPSVAKAGTHKIYYSFTDGNSCVNTDSTNIQVDSIPRAAITSAGPFCENGGMQVLTAAVNAGGRFYGGSFIDSAGNFDPSVAMAGTHKVYYSFTDGNSCSNTDSTTITVDTIPSAAITAAGPFCENAGVQVLSAAVNAGGRFFGGSFIDSAGNFDPSMSTSGTHKVYYSFTDGNSCSNIDSTTILIDTIPNASIVPAGPFCENGGSQLLSAAINSGGRFFGGSFIDSAGNFDPAVATSGTHKIYYRFTDANSCVNTDSTNIQVDSIPSAAITAAGPFCENGGAQVLTAVANSGGRFFGGSFIDSAGNFDPSVAMAGTHKVYYSFTDGNTCSNTDSISIQVDTIPSAAITAAGPFCENAGVQVLSSALNAGGLFFGGSFIDSAGNFDPALATSGTHKIYYSFTDGNSCSNTDSTTILVDTIPNAAIVPAGPFCENGGSQLLSAAINSGGRFFGGSFIDSAGNFDPSVATAGTHKIYYRFIDGNTCSNTDSTSIQVDSIPSAAISAAGPFCENGGMQVLSAAVNAGGRFFGGSLIDSAGNFDPSVAMAGTHKVYYSFTDGNSCSNTDSTNILVDTIPSAAITAAGPFCENAGVQVLSAAVNAGGRFFGGSFIDSAGNFDPALANAGTHKIYYSFTDGNSCSNTDSTTILVDTIPNAAIVPAGPFCENGGSQLLSAAINSGGRFFGGSFIDSAGNFDPAVATSGTHKVFYSFTDGNSCSNTDSASILVDTIPSAAITSAGPFCENGGMQVLSAAVNAGGRFFGGSFIDSAGNFDPAVATSETHKVYYSFTDGNTCSNTDSTNILVDTIPSAAITAAGPFCENVGVQVLSAAVNAGGRFFGGSFIDSAGNFDPALANAGTHKIYYSFTDGNSCSNTDSTTILVDTIPNAAIVPAGPFCENGGSQLLSAAINSGGRFFGGSFIDSTGNFDPAVATAGTHKVFYSFTDGNSCSNTDSNSIQVDTIPSAAITSAGPFCENGGMQVLNAAVNAGGRFFGGSFIDSAGNFGPAVATSGTHKVYYSFTDGNTCSNTDSTNILVDTIPNAAITAAGPFCENVGVQVLSAAVNAGGRFFGGSFIDSAGNFDPALAMGGTHKIYYSFTDGNSCSNTDSTTIRVDSIPSAAIVPAGPFCENSGAQQILPLSNTGGVFSGGTFIDASGNFDPAVAASGLHHIYYHFVDANACENKDSTTVEVYLKPDASITTIGPLCLNAPSVQLQVAEAGGSFSGGAYIDAGGVFYPMVADTGLHTVIYQINNSQNCSESDTIQVRVHPLPDSSWTAIPTEGCEPLMVELNSNTRDEVNWVIPSLLDSRNAVENVQLDAGDYNLQITFNNTFGCVIQNDTVIEVHQKPIAAFSFAPETIYMSRPEVSFTDQSTGPVSSWQWSFGDGNFSSLQNPIHSYTQSGDFDVMLVVSTDEFCMDTTILPLEVNADFMVHIPNAISPDGDGLNDEFSFVGQGIERVSIKIYNRWGEKLFESDNFTSWDATYQGSPVPMGVYMYMMTFYDLKGMKHHRNGDVRVIR